LLVFDFVELFFLACLLSHCLQKLIVLQLSRDVGLLNVAFLERQ
jgi:hypothetical protein